jgi:hypothetical protein
MFFSTGKKGCEKANTKHSKVKQRINKTNHSFKRDFALLCSCRFLKKRTLVKYTTLYFLKLKRCIMMGIAIENEAHKKEGYRKYIALKLTIKAKAASRNLNTYQQFFGTFRQKIRTFTLSNHEISPGITH